MLFYYDYSPSELSRNFSFSFEYKRFSEADLKDSLDNGNDENENNEQNIEEELTLFEKRLAVDYQLQRAIDLIRGVSLYKETIQ